MRNLPSWLVLTVLVLLGGPPIAALALTSLRTGNLTPNVAWSLENYAEVARQLSVAGPLVNSLVFACGSALLALALGTLLAFIVERTNTPFRSAGYILAIIVIAIPAPVYAIAYMLMFSRTGLANVALAGAAGAFGVEFGGVRIANLAGMIVVEGMNYAPLAFLLLVGPMRSIDRSLEEAALTSGASSFQVLTRISGTLLLPSFIAILLLTFVRSLEAFAIPAIIGMPGRVTVVTTEIYYATMQTLPPNYGLASAYGLVLIAVVAAFLYLYTRVTAQSGRFATVTGKGYRARIIEYGRARYVFLGIVGLYFLVLVILPLLVLVLASLQSYYSGASLKNLSLEQYRELFDYGRIGDAFLNSILVGAAAAAVIMLITTAAAWLSIRVRTGAARWLDFWVSLPLVLPGIVLGLALLQIYARVPLPIYGTITILILASVTRFLPFGYRYAHAGLLQVHPELEEAGLTSGANRLQIAWRIVAPLIALPLLAGFIYLFLISVRELEASVLLVTSRTPMIAPLLLNLFENGFIPQVAAFSTAIVLVFGVIAFAFYLIARRYGMGVH